VCAWVGGGDVCECERVCMHACVCTRKRASTKNVAQAYEGGTLHPHPHILLRTCTHTHIALTQVSVQLTHNSQVHSNLWSRGTAGSPHAL